MEIKTLTIRIPRDIWIKLRRLQEEDKIKSIALLFDMKFYQKILDEYEKRGAKIQFGQGLRPLIHEKDENNHIKNHGYPIKAAGSP